MPPVLPVIVCLSVALLLAVVALAREVRLRRALQLLLARLFARWRSHDDETHAATTVADDDRNRLS